MFYFSIPSIGTYKILLVIAAVIPAAFLMFKVYRSDRLEKESPGMLWRLTKAGIFAALIALVLERAGSALLDLLVREESAAYNVILYFVVVALSEEGAKYFLLKRSSWRSPEFDCQFDGVVYAVFVSLGFALWENVSYVMAYGFQTAILRALTAIPGHACFGVFMGVFYGLARRSENGGRAGEAKACRILSLLVPILLHGAYDYVASAEGGDWIFVGFILLLFAVSYLTVGIASRRDRFI
ncbi:MAG: PrsW family intramembrane metalloprotease [Clostridia bacterium]|nr:PrsW family intramembrane metalloprotease [Clostridia bacterium]